MAVVPGSNIRTVRERMGARVACLCPTCSTPFRPEAQGRYTCPKCSLILELWMTEAAVKDRRPETAVASVAAASDDHPSCVLHPQNGSIVACGRCGDFICDVCRISMEGRDLCPACFERGIDKAELGTVQRQFRQPQVSLVVAVLSFPAFIFVYYAAAFVGLMAVGIGIQALMRISRQPTLGGRGKAIAGIILGSIGFFLWVTLFISAVT